MGEDFGCLLAPVAAPVAVVVGEAVERGEDVEGGRGSHGCLLAGSWTRLLCRALTLATNTTPPIRHVSRICGKTFRAHPAGLPEVGRGAGSFGKRNVLAEELPGCRLVQAVVVVGSLAGVVGPADRRGHEEV